MVDLAGAGVFLGGAAAFLTVILSWHNARKIKEVKAVAIATQEVAVATHREVATINNQTAAQLLDANETRRIQAKIAAGEPLTPQDESHMRSVEEAAYRLAHPDLHRGIEDGNGKAAPAGGTA